MWVPNDGNIADGIADDNINSTIYSIHGSNIMNANNMSFLMQINIWFNYKKVPTLI